MTEVQLAVSSPKQITKYDSMSELYNTTGVPSDNYYADQARLETSPKTAASPGAKRRPPKRHAFAVGNIVSFELREFSVAEEESVPISRTVSTYGAAKIEPDDSSLWRINHIAVGQHSLYLKNHWTRGALKSAPGVPFEQLYLEPFRLATDKSSQPAETLATHHHPSSSGVYWYLDTDSMLIRQIEDDAPMCHLASVTHMI